MTNRVDIPAAGFYRIRLTRGGIWVPVHIWHGPPHDPETGEKLDRSYRWQAKRNGEYVDVSEVWPWCAKEPITEEEYHYMLATKNWAETNAPESPEAQPRRKIDLLTAPIRF